MPWIIVALLFGGSAIAYAIKSRPPLPNPQAFSRDSEYVQFYNQHNGKLTRLWGPSGKSRPGYFAVFLDDDDHTTGIPVYWFDNVKGSSAGTQFVTSEELSKLT